MPTTTVTGGRLTGLRLVQVHPEEPLQLLVQLAADLSAVDSHTATLRRELQTALAEAAAQARTSDAHRTHGRLRDDLRAAEAALAEAEAAAAAGPAEIKDALAASHDPSEAEARYRRALTEVSVLDARVVALRQLERDASAAAVQVTIDAKDRAYEQIAATLRVEAADLEQRLVTVLQDIGCRLLAVRGALSVAEARAHPG